MHCDCVLNHSVWNLFRNYSGNSDDRNIYPNAILKFMKRDLFNCSFTVRSDPEALNFPRKISKHDLKIWEKIFKLVGQLNGRK